MGRQYWRFERPEHEDYYRGFFINGTSHHPMCIPWVTCPKCDNTFSAGKTLSILCPGRVVEMLRPLGKGPLPWEQHAEFRREVEAVLRSEGHDIQVQPGDQFQPLHWEVPSRPRQDVFWAGPGDIIVSEWGKALFEEYEVGGVEFHPIVFEKVGMLEPWDEFPSEDLSDPIDLFDMVPLLENAEDIGEFYEMLVQTDTDDMAPPQRPRPEEEPCSFCGQPKNPDVSFVYEPLPLVLPKAYVPDVDIFGSHILRSFVVSDKVESLVRQHRLEQCGLTKLRIE